MDETALDFNSVEDCGILSGQPPGCSINKMLNVPECSVDNTTTAKFDIAPLNNTPSPL